MVAEGRVLPSVQHGQRQINFLLLGTPQHPPHAIDLLVSGSSDQVQEHWHQAVDVYQKLYARNNMPCTVQVS